MDLDIVLTPVRLDVPPGGETHATVAVHAQSERVEQYRLEVVGPAARWAEVVPSQLSIDAGGDQRSAQVIFRPPSGPIAPAGEVPFAVLCSSLEQSGRSAAAEGDVRIEPRADHKVTVTPVAASGRWSGKYHVRVVNRGNVPMHVRLAAADESQKLSFALAPRRLAVRPNSSADALLRVRARNPMLVGKRAKLPFQIFTSPDRSNDVPPGGPNRVEEAGVEAEFEQRPVVSKILLAVVGVAVVAAAAALVLLAPPPAELPQVSSDPIAPRAPALEAVEPPTGQPDVAGLQMRWTQVQEATSYRIDKMLSEAGTDVEASATVEAPQNVYLWPDLSGGTQHCFRVAAVNDAGDSAPTPTRCGTTPEAEAGPSTEIRGAHAILQAFSLDQADRAEQLRAQLRDGGVEAKVISSLDTETLEEGPDGTGLLVVYVDGFESEPEAAEFCQRRPAALQQLSDCRPRPAPGDQPAPLEQPGP